MSGSHVLLAMQKVEGSSPFSRSLGSGSAGPQTVSRCPLAAVLRSDFRAGWRGCATRGTTRWTVYPDEPKGIYDIGEDVVHGVGGCAGAMERFPIGGPLTRFLGGEGAYTSDMTLPRLGRALGESDDSR